MLCTFISAIFLIIRTAGASPAVWTAKVAADGIKMLKDEGFSVPGPVRIQTTPCWAQSSWSVSLLSSSILNWAQTLVKITFLLRGDFCKTWWPPAPQSQTLEDLSREHLGREIGRKVSPPCKMDQVETMKTALTEAELLEKVKDRRRACNMATLVGLVVS